MSQDEHPEDEGEGFEVCKPGPEDTGIWPAILDQAGEPEPTESAVVDEAAAASTTTSEGPVQSSDSAGPSLAGPEEYGPRVLAALNQINLLLDVRLGALETLFDREVRAEATRERIVDRLHAELQEYKHDLLLKVQRPIFIDLIQLHDDLGKLVDAQQADDPQRAESLRSALESVRTAIEDILYRQGVEPFRTETAEFDPRRQRAVSTVVSEDPQQNKTVAARLRPGFQAGEKLIRPEIVSVYTLKK